MQTLTDRGLILRVNNTASLTTTHYFQSKECVVVNTETAGHGGLVAAVSGCFSVNHFLIKRMVFPCTEMYFSFSNVFISLPKLAVTP